MNRNAIRAGLFALGFISISTQIYLLRESYIVFYGNELILGIALSLWMLLTGTGAWLGRFFERMNDKAGFLLFLMLLLSVMPVMMTLKLNLYRAVALPTGALAGINDVMYCSFLVELPFCLLNGFLFSALSSMLGKAGRAFSIEALGSVVSGALVNFIFLWFFSSGFSQLLITGMFLTVVVYISFHTGSRVIPWIILPISLLIMALLSMIDTRGISNKALYPGQDVVEQKETPYGQLVVTANSGQINVYENGLLLFSSGDLIKNEENVHYAMIQHPFPKTVLLVSGGLSGAIDEILKYHISRIDYVELNPALLQMSVRSLRSFEKRGVFLHSGDARVFVRNSPVKYDVILVLLPPPSSLQLNRLYTTEFINEMKDRLSPDGIVSYSLPTTSDYISKAGEGLNSILYQTIKESFRHILIMPGNNSFFIASDAILSLDIPRMIERKGINTSYVNKDYLNTAQIIERSEYLRANIVAEAGINRDFRPLMFFAEMKYRMSFFNRHYVIATLVFLLMMTFVVLNLNPVNTGLFTSGFTAGAMQVLLLLSLQVSCGYVFRLTGFIIMLFMIGLAMGSAAGTRWFTGRTFRVYLSIMLMIAALCILIPAVLIPGVQTGIPERIIQLVVAAITILVSSLTGMQYSLAFRLSEGSSGRSIAKNYSADLFGSALGAFIIPLFIFPLYGMMSAGCILALLNSAAAALLVFNRKKFITL